MRTMHTGRLAVLALGMVVGAAGLGAAQGLEGPQVADSLYRAGQTALDRGQFERAAGLFARIHDRYPASTYAPDSYYWQAFALYRTGDDSNLRRARALLDDQRSRHPRAGTRGDANALATRINGELARRGDGRAAETIATTASSAAPRTSTSTSSSASTRTSTTTSTSSSDSCSDDNDDRVEALNALLQMDSERALPILRRVLARRDPCSVQLRRKAIFLVSQKRSAETEDILLDALKNDPDREVREQAVFWLSQVPTEKAIDALLNILRTSTEVEIQKKALFAMSQHRSERGMDALREIAGRANAPRELRADAIFWLGQRKRTASAEFLRDLYAKLDDEELKDKVIFSLSQMKGVGNEEWMLNLALDEKENIEMRKKALFWAGQGGASMEQLAGLYTRMKDREMREQLIFVYSRRKDSRAVDKLLEIAKSDPDRELRKKAIFWLGQSRDPRAAQFLEELITKP